MNKSLIEATVLVPDLAASTRDTALGELLGAIVEAGALNAKARKTVFDQLLEREAQGSTGLGNGVAVPHVKETAVEEIVVSVGVTSQGIDFEAIDGRPVHILFMVLGPTGGPPEDHLGVLRWVSRLARNADFRRFASKVVDREELHDLLIEMTEDS